MLVSELLTESTMTTKSALDQLISNAGKMYLLYADTLTDRIKRLYAEGNHEDMYRTAKNLAGRTKGKWFAENYLSTSTRRDIPTAGLKNSLVALARDPRFSEYRSELLHLGSLQIYASSDQRMEMDASFGQHVNTLEILPKLLNKLATKSPIEYRERLTTIALRLENSIRNFYELWKKLHDEWDREWGKAADTRANREQKQREKAGEKQAASSQRSQAEDIVQQVLNSLPKNVAGEVRNAIARSDNKLLALQQELHKRGITV